MADAETATAGSQRKSGVERRRVFVLLNLWQTLAGDAKMPPVKVISAKRIGELWDLCFILDRREDAKNPKFSHFGRDLVPITGVNLTNKRRSMVPINNVVDYATLYHDRVASEAVPVSEGGRIKDDQGREVLFRSIMLPLSDNNRDVHALLGIATFKVT